MSPRSLAALVLLALPALLDGAVEIVRVWPSYRDTDSFRRIGEYLGGRENAGRDTVLRSQTEARDGYYFLTRVAADAATPVSQLVVEVVLPGKPEIRTFSFPVTLGAGDGVFHLGLTGSDWPGPDIRPAAWRLTARTADGSTVAELASFLWSAPSGAK